MESPDVPWGKRDDRRVRKPLESKPSKAAAFFLSFLKSRGIAGGRLIDLGCGAGRNAVFFANEGFEVHAVDRSDDVLKDMDLHGVMPHCHSVTDYWLFEDDFFDLALDIFCFSEQKERERKESYVRELMRVLKKGGYFLLSVPRDGPLDEIRSLFGNFDIIESEEGEDVVYGKKIKTINLVMRKK